jgi:hypothetical protein
VVSTPPGSTRLTVVPARRLLGLQRARQAVHGPLARDVRRQVRCADPAHDRAQQHQVAGELVPVEVLERGPGHIGGAGHVDLDDAVENVGRDLVEVPVGGDAGGVHHAVDRAETCGRLGQGVLDGLLVGHVGGEHQGRRAAGATAVPLDPLELRGAPCEQGDRVAATGEQQGHGASDPAGGSGDQDGPALMGCAGLRGHPSDVPDRTPGTPAAGQGVKTTLIMPSSLARNMA